MSAGSDEGLRWWVDCTDASGRSRQLTVLVLGDRVAVVTPPGETAVMEPSDAVGLAQALERASEAQKVIADGRPLHPETIG
ncbi:hypothetical protein [Actinoalloteichus hymeniacidonis]|uniref:Uncharacterized protein n=1 Tax=Actinoalloteichus hymeniacidonis TaxID=340345 RepID=A0AAC9MWG5_9PSEU|nr:hypothetical protein [Actinoalloteichus hymeniacidonis]AOS61064.1 hypothetical protein TL08_01110 [Actinoalloteichus hymeniacidonis]MBB5910936.1 hypothetical protein [Actinoalloteichus hymeniacidonis]